jgi:tetratricopeptide (TPR) repeat protein
MNKIKNIVGSALLLLLLVLTGFTARAQVTIEQARHYAADKDYNKAVSAYKELYTQSPDSLYKEYLSILLTAEKYKDAEKVVSQQMAKSSPFARNPGVNLDMGIVYAKWGKNDKAKVQFDSVLNMLNGDDLFTNAVAKMFSDAGRDDYAILAYQRALQLLGNPPLYNRQIAMLYAKTGNLDKAVDALLQVSPGQYLNVEATKAILLELLGNDPAKLQQTQKAIVKKINEQPDNVYYAEILTWIYTQKNDWDGALIQIEAIDERNKETGKRLFDLARTAATAKQYDVANRAYDDVIAKGRDLPYYVVSKSEKLATALAQVESNPNRKPEEVTALAVLYDSFLVEFPKQYTQQTAADFATLEAIYGNNTHRAIEILHRGIEDPDTRRDMQGKFKLQLGDYFVLIGKLWDASLTYSQVDKEFKQDVMGEDARFRNARLAFYRGDFTWAQKQLTVLKSATSELISNDAIDLSVLITENIEDSIQLPLQRFAYAGLLLFENKDKEAETLLDSIATAYPKHPLNDDIVMKHADIALKHLDYLKAIGYLKVIIDKYGKDVLGDDAVFKTAEIYYSDLHQKDQAKAFYEQLIIDYPGSTYVQAARQKLAVINSEIVQ